MDNLLLEGPDCLVATPFGRRPPIEEDGGSKRMSTNARCEELLKKVNIRLSFTLLRLILSPIQLVFGLCARFLQNNINIQLPPFNLVNVCIGL